MILYKKVIKLKKGQSLYIIPFGDMQSDEEIPHFLRVLDWIKSVKDHGDLFLAFGLGDYYETFSPRARADMAMANSGYGYYETIQKSFDESEQQKSDRVVELLYPIRKDIMGMLRGHHWHNFFAPEGKKQARTSDIYITEKLDTEYWGDVVKIHLLVNGVPFEIFAMHGYGSARTITARINKRINMRAVYPGAHWYIQGHDNESFVIPKDVLKDDGSGRDFDGMKQYFTGGGCFQRAYHPGVLHGGYIERGCYPPATIGVIKCHIWMDQYSDNPKLAYDITA